MERRGEESQATRDTVETYVEIIVVPRSIHAEIRTIRMRSFNCVQLAELSAPENTRVEWGIFAED
ncbi:unnamed protein product [Clonostachys rosea]|uniref:Uncharacterized protein n=1 Tax=Bionectria ochroleuca TaxID=29856 RepID=A0ABY6U0N0_BIOOC|nr:unnamed protein product [Clonostachys rosea]